MSKFKVFFNTHPNYSGVSINPLNESDFPEGTYIGVPADIWEDWQRRYDAAEKGEDFFVRDSLLCKAIQPDVPAKGRKLRSFAFVIKGEGMAHNVLAAPQTGPFKNRPKTESEKQFTYWFYQLCEQKFRITPKWPSK